MQFSLYVRRGPSSGEVFPLSDALVTLIGRNSSNHVVLLDKSVSANHCVIRPRRSEAGFVLMDAHSRRGTRVNDRPAGKALIGLGDAISLGPFELEVIETPPGEYAVPPKRPAADRPPRFELVPRGWRKRGQPLPPGSATIVGRSRLAHIRVDDTFVSACHCLLCLDPTDDGCMPFVIDLHSSNGTCINRRLIRRKHLLPGDVLAVGGHPFKLRRLEGAVVAAPEPEVEIPPAPPRARVVTTEILPAAAAPDLPARGTPEPVTFAPEPEVAASPRLEPIIPEPPPAPEPPADEQAPSLADVLAPVEVGEGEMLDDALTEADFEVIDEPDEQPVEPPAPAAPPVPGPPRRDTETKLLPRQEGAAVPALEEERRVGTALEETRALEVVTLRGPAVPMAAPPRLLTEGPDDYDDFFGFEHPPFHLKPDPGCFFDSQHHWDALDTLVGWLKAGPPVAVLFGEPGCGKSLLVECLARRLTYRRPAPVVVRSPQGDGSPPAVIAATLARANELYADLAADGDEPLKRWHAAMRDLYVRRGLVVFLLDDADALREEDLRAMAELLESDGARGVVRLLLAGGEDLRELVAQPPLSYHLGTSCYLAPLAPDEVAGYLAQRLFCAWGKRELPFTQQAVELIAECSGGVPTLISVVADAALLQAFRQGRRQIGHDIVEQAVADALEPGQRGETA